jgi:hypothetical protein
MGEDKDKQIKRDSEQARLLKAWRISMAQIPLPKKGSFEASFPGKEWREVPSTKAPPYPMPPKGPGPKPLTVGASNDVSARAPSGLISSATGSFDSVTGVASEGGQNGGTGPVVANAYSLQLNTNFFTSTIAGSPTGSQGWEQFVFSNNGTSGLVYIQYWLINWGATSPGSGWIGPIMVPNLDTCWYRNSLATSVSNQPITNLANLSLGGTVSASADTCFFSTGSMMYARAGINAVNAATGWNTAEFCVVGNGGNGQANFTPLSSTTPATIVVRTEIIYGGTAAPLCAATGFTAETNNLSFGPAAPLPSPPGPALLATESSAGNVTAFCMAATAVGDPHLTTFKGLLYDFQASGEFILAEVDPDFVVQTRKVSGAPTWPNASVNSAVATRMGKTTVAVCLNSLTIDGKTTDLGDGKSLSTPDGVDVTRRANVYFITNQSGYSVRATVYPSWIDVHVGLGNCSAEVKGLLANANGNVNQIAARDGTVLTNPFNFEQVYHHYADSWRVSPKESLLHPCGDKDLKIGIPEKPFYARDLDAKVYERALAVAKKAGVEEGALLDAATLDVAVIGDDRAVQVFVGASPPIAVGKIITSSGY